MSIATIEADLITRLQTLEADQNLKVIAFPTNPDELYRPPCDRIIVGFNRESLSRPNTTSFTAPIIQERQLDFGIYVQIRDLRGRKQSNPRLVELMDLIRDLITGMRPTGDKTHWFYQTAGSFVQLAEAFWLYSMNFSISVPYTKRDRS
jgi:hypothetical protein